MKKLPSDLKWEILCYFPTRFLPSAFLIDKSWKEVGTNEFFWRGLCIREPYFPFFIEERCEYKDMDWKEKYRFFYYYNSQNRFSRLNKIKFTEDDACIQFVYLKLLLIGRNNAGKNKFMKLFDNNENNFTPKLESDVKGICFRDNFTGNIIKLQIWNTSEIERFREMTTFYYRGANGFVLLIDLTKDEYPQLDVCDYYLESIRKYNNRSLEALDYEVLLVGTKLDELAERKIKRITALEYAKREGFEYFEISSLEHPNLENSLFFLISKMLKVKKEEKPHKHQNQNFVIGKKQQKKKEKCILS